MTEKTESPFDPPQPSDDGSQPMIPAIDPTLDRLITQALGEVEKGKMDLSDLIQSLASDHLKDVEVKPKAIKVPAITEDQREALAKVVEVYGRVAPSAPRVLTKQELHDIVVERDVVDTVLSFLEARKSTSIRETLANHLDRRAEADPEVDHENALRDKNGHLAIKQEESVEGTGRKIQRTVSGGKPRLTAEILHQAWQDGILTREEYLALTRMPEAPRVFDPTKANQAIRKDKALLFKLAQIAEPTTPTTTIKVQKDT